MPQNENDILRALSFLSNLENASRQMQSLNGEIVIKDGDIIDGGIESGRTRLSDTDQEAIEEHEYQQLRSGEYTGSIKKSFLDRYLIDIIEKKFGNI